MGLGRRWSSLYRRLWLTPVPGWRSLSNQTQSQILNPQQQPQREELPREKATPWLMLSSPSDPQNRHFYELTADDSRIKPRMVVELPDIAGNFCFGSSQGYIFTIPPVEEGLSPEIRATNPLTGRPLPVPSVNLLPPHPNRWHSIPYSKSRYYPLFFGRAFLSPSLDTLYLLRDGVLDIAKLGTEAQWIQHKYGYQVTNDCVLYKGRLYAVGYEGELVIFDPEKPMESSTYEDIELPLMSENHHFKNYLVVSPDGKDLFLLYRGLEESKIRVPRTKLFKVFKLQEGPRGQRKWKRVKSLKRLALFVGVNHSISCYARHFRRLVKPNCIYFTDDNRNYYRDVGLSREDTGVFCLADEKTEYYEMAGDEDLSFNGPPPVWVEAPMAQ